MLFIRNPVWRVEWLNNLKHFPYISDLKHWLNIFRVFFSLITLLIGLYVVSIILEHPNESYVFLPMLSLMIGAIFAIIVIIYVFIKEYRIILNNKESNFSSISFIVFSFIVNLHFFAILIVSEMTLFHFLTGVGTITEYTGDNFLFVLSIITLSGLVFGFFALLFNFLYKNREYHENPYLKASINVIILLIIILSLTFHILYILSGKPIICLQNCSHM